MGTLINQVQHEILSVPFLAPFLAASPMTGRLADDSSVASLAFNALGACGYPNASLAFCSMATQMLWRLVLFFAKLQHLGTFSRAAATSLQPCHLRWHHHILHWVTGLILQRAASLQVNCFTSVTAALRSLGRGAQW